MSASGIHSWNQLLVYRMINSQGLTPRTNATLTAKETGTLSLLQTTPPPSVLRASPHPPLSAKNWIQRCWLPQLMGTEQRKGVSCVALPAHLSKQELLSAQKKEKGAGNTVFHCCICLQCIFLARWDNTSMSLIPWVTRHK